MSEQYGLEDVCLSLPTIVNNRGINKIVDVPLNQDEKDLFIKSGNSLKEVIKKLDI